jgi:hypothetical protein
VFWTESFSGVSSVDSNVGLVASMKTSHRSFKKKRYAKLVASAKSRSSMHELTPAAALLRRCSSHCSAMLS